MIRNGGRIVTTGLTDLLITDVMPLASITRAIDLVDREAADTIKVVLEI